MSERNSFVVVVSQNQETGEIEFLSPDGKVLPPPPISGKEIVLVSPNGQRHRYSAADDGTLVRTDAIDRPPDAA